VSAQAALVQTIISDAAVGLDGDPDYAEGLGGDSEPLQPFIVPRPLTPWTVNSDTTLSDILVQSYSRNIFDLTEYMSNTTGRKGEKVIQLFRFMTETIAPRVSIDVTCLQHMYTGSLRDGALQKCRDDTVEALVEATMTTLYDEETAMKRKLAEASTGRIYKCLNISARPFGQTIEAVVRRVSNFKHLESFYRGKMREEDTELTPVTVAFGKPPLTIYELSHQFI
jgi:hypothetical protein